jgi:hypothetical protein
MKNELPERVKVLLWDVDIKSVSLEQHSKFIIERVLEYGDIAEFNWLKKTYPKDLIIDALSSSRRLSVKSALLFANYYNISKDSVLCLKNPYTQKQNRF